MAFTQKDKQKHGATFEREFKKALTTYGEWGHKLICDGFTPQPFDFIFTLGGRVYGAELKSTMNDTLPFSAIRESQRIGLTSFNNKTDGLSSFVLIKDCNENLIYVVPWYHVKDDVCSGKRGSINYKDYVSIGKNNGVWDIKELKNAICEF